MYTRLRVLYSRGKRVTISQNNSQKQRNNLVGTQKRKNRCIRTHYKRKKMGIKRVAWISIVLVVVFSSFTWAYKYDIAYDFGDSKACEDFGGETCKIHYTNSDVGKGTCKGYAGNWIWETILEFDLESLPIEKAKFVVQSGEQLECKLNGETVLTHVITTTTCNNEYPEDLDPSLFKIGKNQIQCGIKGRAGQGRYAGFELKEFSFTITEEVEADSSKFACEEYPQGARWVTDIDVDQESDDFCCGDDASDDPGISDDACISCPLGDSFGHRSWHETLGCCGVDNVSQCGIFQDEIYLCSDAEGRSTKWSWGDSSESRGNIVRSFCSEPAVSYVSDGNDWIACTPPILPTGCTDTDSGNDYENQGTVTVTVADKEFIHTDSCDGNNLLEYSCSEGFVVKNTTFRCENSCSNGACQSLSCTDQDYSGSEVYQYYAPGTAYDIDSSGQGSCGQEQYEGLLIETYCKDGEYSLGDYDCPEGCSGGTCQVICEDKGTNFYATERIGKGEVSLTDYCSPDGTLLFETQCSSGKGNYIMHECENGCVNGKCIRNKEKKTFKTEEPFLVERDQDYVIKHGLGRIPSICSVYFIDDESDDLNNPQQRILVEPVTYRGYSIHHVDETHLTISTGSHAVATALASTTTKNWKAPFPGRDSQWANEIRYHKGYYQVICQIESDHNTFETDWFSVERHKDYEIPNIFGTELTWCTTYFKPNPPPDLLIKSERMEGGAKHGQSYHHINEDTFTHSTGFNGAVTLSMANNGEEGWRENFPGHNSSGRGIFNWVGYFNGYHKNICGRAEPQETSAKIVHASDWFEAKRNKNYPIEHNLNEIPAWCSVLFRKDETHDPFIVQRTDKGNDRGHSIHTVTETSLVVSTGRGAVATTYTDVSKNSGWKDKFPGRSGRDKNEIYYFNGEYKVICGSSKGADRDNVLDTSLIAHYVPKDINRETPHTFYDEGRTNPLSIEAHDYICTDDQEDFDIYECCGAAPGENSVCNDEFNPSLGKFLGDSVSLYERYFYCTEGSNFTSDLDQLDAQYACEAAKAPDGTPLGLNWTGTLCCAEPHDGAEYYNDPGTDLDDSVHEERGACFDGHTIYNGQRVEDYAQLLVINGTVSGCATNRITLPENTYLLNLTDNHTQQPLVKSKPYCTYDDFSGHFCDLTGNWTPLPSGESDNIGHSQIPLLSWINESNTERSCCSDFSCWTGDSCYPDQKTLPKGLPYKDDYRCVQGHWQISPVKNSMDNTEQGYCPRPEQCLVSTTGKAQDNDNPLGDPQCITEGQFIGDSYCVEGKWSTRTRSAGLPLLNFTTPQDFTLYCGSHEQTLNYFDYSLDVHKLFGLTQGSTPSIPQLCLLKTQGTFYLSAPLNKAPSSDSALSAVLGPFTDCQQGDPDSFSSCNGEGLDDAWWNNATNTIIYSNQEFNLTPVDQHTLYEQHIEPKLNTTLNVLSSSTINKTFVQSGLDLDHLYIEETPDKKIFATWDKDTTGQYIVARYEGLDAQNVCTFIDHFGAARGQGTVEGTEIGIECMVSDGGTVANIIAKQTANININVIWTDLTGKLRLQ